MICTAWCKSGTDKFQKLDAEDRWTKLLQKTMQNKQQTIQENHTYTDVVFVENETGNCQPRTQTTFSRYAIPRRENVG